MKSRSCGCRCAAGLAFLPTQRGFGDAQLDAAHKRHRSFALIQGAGTPARVMPRSGERFEERPNITISAPDISTAMPMYHA
jgi:hypothetical protein